MEDEQYYLALIYLELDYDIFVKWLIRMEFIGFYDGMRMSLCDDIRIRHGDIFATARIINRFFNYYGIEKTMR